MSTTRHAQRGFTMIEMMVVIAIIAVIAALATASIIRSRPRANLAGAAVDLQALLHGARQQALAAGDDVVVMVFPGYVGVGDSVGRVVVYRDGNHTLFDDAAAVNFDDYAPATPAADSRSEVLETLDLPPAVRIGPANGMGATAVLPAPFAAIPVNLDCTFCAGTGAGRRGAVLFDSRGRATFYAANGAPLTVAGGSLSLTIPGLAAGAANQVRTLAVSASTGAVRAVTNG